MTSFATIYKLLVLLPLSLPLLAQSEAASVFTRDLIPALEQAQCRQCHSDSGVASTTRLQFPPQNATATQWRAFSLNLRRFVDMADPAKSPIITKPTARVAHGGGERIKKDSDADKALQAWAAHLAGMPEAKWKAELAALTPRETKAHQALVRRLTHSQYNNTVRDLLGDESRPANQFPQEDYIHGFKNMAEGQGIPPLLAEAYTMAAERLARNAFRGGDRNNLIPCQPASRSDRACAEKFISTFGGRAFRRPLEEVEVQRYTEVLMAGAETDFLDGARLIVEAMLQSPHFLLHVEQGPQGKWEQYRTASRLSFFLWDTMPSKELFELAEQEKLGTSEQIEAAARMLLDHPRAKGAFEEFLSQWLRFDRALTTIRDRRFYPNFTTELAAAMTEETKGLFNHLVWEGQDFREFFTAPYTFINGDLAKVYELPPPPTDFAKVSYPEDSPRAGILGQGLFLTLTSKPSETSPTERGLFVREHFLCQNVPSPPPGVNASLPPVTDEKPLTNRDRLKIHLTSESCSSCHRLIDPIGFGFEKFDAIGGFREAEFIKIPPTRDEAKSKKKTEITEHRLELDTTAWVTGIPNSNFTTPKELSGILANNDICQKCVVKQVFRYGLGREETEADRERIDAIFDRFRRSQFQFRELVLGVVTSPQFLGGTS